jgi:flagellar biosynthesis protein FlhF
MNVRRFVAANAREALRQVKESLGADAVILANRNVAGGVEITAAAATAIAEMAGPAVVGSPRERSAVRTALGAQFSDDGDDYQVSLSSRPVSAGSPVAPARLAGTASELPASRPRVDFSRSERAAATRPDRPAEPDPAPLRRPAEPSSAGANVVPQAVMEELRSLRQMVEQQLAGFAWREMAGSHPARAALTRRMLDAGFSPSFARATVDRVPAGVDDRAALDWAQDALAQELRTAGADLDLVDRGGVYALVGPTGVGKTTTAAKLAARCVLRYGASRVALITTDGYRIGAHEQLRIYGRILGVPVHGVRDLPELKATLRDLSMKHMVVIDTMGMSQRDKNVIGQSAMLGEANVKRLLLLSATSRADTLDDVIAAYGRGGLAGCIVSKVDEAVGLAGALDAVLRHRLPLRYVSNGQRVPEDLHLPNALYLAHRAFKSLPEDSPHRHRDAEPALAMAAGIVTAGRA